MYGTLICSGTGIKKNIGDYIQSLAQLQYYPKNDCYVEREHLDTYQSNGGGKTKVIMNGWFMWNPENFPPSEDIDPLFISFHIVPAIADRFFTDKTISYLKRYEPIGARDTGTKELLEKYEIKSYFSGCLTLTLGKDYKSDEKDDHIYFVDPFYEPDDNLASHLLRFLSSILYLKKILKLSKNFEYEFYISQNKLKAIIKKISYMVLFYKTYSKMFSDDILLNAKFIKHEVNQSDFNGDSEKMEYAKELMRKYSRAKLVVTSRIHCALPCIGVETPVIFIDSEALNGARIRSSGRFGGLTDMMHVAKWTPNGVCAESDELKKILNDGRISTKSIIENKKDYIEYKEELEKSVLNFLAS